jgi:hypothetical protein
MDGVRVDGWCEGRWVVLWPRCPLELGTRKKRERKTEWKNMLIAYMKAMNHRKCYEMRYSDMEL